MLPDQQNASDPIRPLSPGRDLPGWLELFHSVESLAGRAERTTEAQLLEALARPDAMRWVIDDPARPGSLAAYGVMARVSVGECGVNVLVAPALRRRGLGSAMTEFLLERARSCEGHYASVYLEPDEDEETRRFLLARGFRVDGHYWLLEAPASLPAEPPDWPQGFIAQSFAEVDSFSILLEAMHRSHAGHWGHMENIPGAVTAETVAGWIEQYGWDPGSMLIAFGPDGRPAGYTRIQLADRSDPQNHDPDVIDNPGVAPEYAGLALQRLLVQEALQFRGPAAGHPIRIESWGDSQETIDLYCQMGFRPIQHGTGYRHDFVKK